MDLLKILPFILTSRFIPANKTLGHTFFFHFTMIAICFLFNERRLCRNRVLPLEQAKLNVARVSPSWSSHTNGFQYSLPEQPDYVCLKGLVPV